MSRTSLNNSLDNSLDNSQNIFEKKIEQFISSNTNQHNKIISQLIFILSNLFIIKDIDLIYKFLNKYKSIDNDQIKQFIQQINNKIYIRYSYAYLRNYSYVFKDDPIISYFCKYSLSNSCIILKLLKKCRDDKSKNYELIKYVSNIYNTLSIINYDFRCVCYDKKNIFNNFSLICCYEKLIKKTSKYSDKIDKYLDSMFVKLLCSNALIDTLI